MNSININTSQNVNLSFQLASVGDRMLAFAIDMLIKFAYLISMWLIFVKAFKLDVIVHQMDNWSIMAVYNIIFIPFNFYTLFFETLMEGQTPGKKIVKIKVIKIDAYQASFLDYFARWVFRLVDVFMSSGAVGVVTIISNKNNQRFGDMVAGTSVISLKSQYDISHTILVDIDDEYTPQFPQVVALSDNDMRIIKDLFNKAAKKQDREVIQKICNKICETTQIKFDKTKLSNAEFVDIVIKDYNYFTGKD